MLLLGNDGSQYAYYQDSQVNYRPKAMRSLNAWMGPTKLFHHYVELMRLGPCIHHTNYIKYTHIRVYDTLEQFYFAEISYVYDNVMTLQK